MAHKVGTYVELSVVVGLVGVRELSGIESPFLVTASCGTLGDEDFAKQTMDNAADFDTADSLSQAQPLLWVWV